MENIFDKLPPLLHKELDRWYRVSLSVLAITFLAMSTAHIFVTLRLRSASFIQDDIISQRTHGDNAQKKLALLEKLNADHASFLPAFSTFLNILPPSIQLLSCKFEPHKLCEFRGKISSRSADHITALITKLQTKLSAVIAHVNTKEESHGIISFHLQAQLK